MNKFFQYLGPRSPWGPIIAATLTVVTIFFVVLLLLPPVFWLFTKWFSVWFG